MGRRNLNDRPAANYERVDPGYPIVVEHADGRRTLTAGPLAMRGRTITCDCCTRAE